MNRVKNSAIVTSAIALCAILIATLTHQTNAHGKLYASGETAWQKLTAARQENPSIFSYRLTGTWDALTQSHIVALATATQSYSVKVQSQGQESNIEHKESEIEEKMYSEHDDPFCPYVHNEKPAKFVAASNEFAAFIKRRTHDQYNTSSTFTQTDLLVVPVKHIVNVHTFTQPQFLAWFAFAEEFCAQQFPHAQIANWMINTGSLQGIRHAHLHITLEHKPQLKTTLSDQIPDMFYRDVLARTNLETFAHACSTLQQYAK